LDAYVSVTKIVQSLQVRGSSSHFCCRNDNDDIIHDMAVDMQAKIMSSHVFLCMCHNNDLHHFDKLLLQLILDQKNFRCNKLRKNKRRTHQNPTEHVVANAERTSGMYISSIDHCALPGYFLYAVVIF